jgi:hypothetical protein
MPISLRPNKRFPIVLECDKDLPSNERPVFYALSKTMEGQQDTLEFLDQLRDQTLEEAFRTTCDKLQELIVGFNNMGNHVFGQHDWRQILSFEEARELIRKVAHNSHLEPEEKKS